MAILCQRIVWPTNGIFAATCTKTCQVRTVITLILIVATTGRRTSSECPRALTFVYITRTVMATSSIEKSMVLQSAMPFDALLPIQNGGSDTLLRKQKE